MQEKLDKFERKMFNLTERFMFKMVLFSVAIMTALGASVIAPALPAIASHFKDTPYIEFLSALVLTIPALSVMIFSPLAGILMDKFGKLKFLYPAILLWVLTGASGYFVNSIYELLLSRVIFGVATAFIATAASSLLADYYESSAQRRQKALSLQGFVMAFGGALLTCVGGFLTSIAWNLVFLVYLSGILVLIFCAFYLFEPKKRKKKEQKIQELPNKFNSKRLLPVYFMGFFIMFIYYLAGTQFPHYIEVNLGLNAKYIGFAMAMPTLSFGIFCYFYKDFAKFLSVRQIYVFALILEALGFFLCFLVDHFLIALFSLFLFGLVGGFIVTNNAAFLFSIVPPHSKAKFYGILASCMFFGQFISPFITTPMVHFLGLKVEFLIWSLVILLVSFLYATNIFLKK
ncbi:multidrug DMT transporter permease [Campylobacter sp. MIT 99-7217]|uniref:MFS transporter n=1 Tax=Campylobacter sp. MIT 99-7217 TaxID=535091 RepID=UPI00115AD877|nr:MFS transporter [Campylobacter sp. MIT 99-7217]TQR33126.1 multidrug DMT transporter permease [Campylobacter sp. MIT 99-7217]